MTTSVTTLHRSLDFSRRLRDSRHPCLGKIHITGITRDVAFAIRARLSKTTSRFRPSETDGRNRDTSLVSGSRSFGEILVPGSRSFGEILSLSMCPKHVMSFSLDDASLSRKWASPTCHLNQAIPAKILCVPDPNPYFRLRHSKPPAKDRNDPGLSFLFFGRNGLQPPAVGYCQRGTTRALTEHSGSKLYIFSK